MWSTLRVVHVYVAMRYMPLSVLMQYPFREVVAKMDVHGSDNGGKRLSVVCEERLVLLAASLIVASNAGNPGKATEVSKTHKYCQLPEDAAWFS